MLLQILPVAILVPALVEAVRTTWTGWRAKTDLSSVIERSGAESAATLRRLVAADDLPGVVAEIRGHLPELPDRERRMAEEALSQSSETGRRSYAQSVIAPSLRQQGA